MPDMLIELLRGLFALGSVILMRWLLDLAKPADDLAWLRRHVPAWSARRLDYYRGTEYIHQLRARRLLRWQ